MPKIEITLPQKSLDRLNRLEKTTEASCYAEVLRNAMRLYEAAIDEASRGGKVVVIRSDGTHLPIFEGADND